VVNAAVADDDTEKTLFTVGKDTRGPEWLPQIASFNKEVFLKHKGECVGLEENLQALPVKCLSPRTLLSKHGIDRLDAVVIDAEGYDYTLVKAFREASIHPAVYFYEHKHLSPQDHEEGVATLVADGYRICIEGPDVLAYRPDVPSM
jgi:hypothetical protein